MSFMMSLNDQAVINALAAAVWACDSAGNPRMASDLSEMALREMDARLGSTANVRKLWEIMMSQDCTLASAARILAEQPVG